MAPITFNVYLVKQGAEAKAAALLPAPVPLAIPSLKDATFSLLPAQPRSPGWFDSLSAYLPAGSDRPAQLQLPAALALCKVGKRTILMSFGSAHSQVKRAIVEPSFGRRVAMNAVPPTLVVELQARQVFATFHRMSERAPGATGHRAFGVEGERDLVAAVEGLTQKPTKLGDRLRGSSSLSLELDPKELPGALAEALNLFGQPCRFAEWSELDNLTPVSDAADIGDLDAALDAYLGASPKDLILAAPGLDEGPAAAMFHVGRMSKTPTLRPLLYPSAFYTAVGGTPSVSAAKATGVHFFDSDRKPIDIRESVYDCIGYETSKKGRSYVLWAGGWYEAAAAFEQRIKQRVKGLPRPPQAPLQWDGTMNEGDYNVAAGKAAGFQNVDKKLVYYGGGQSKFEFCDLIHEQSKTLYFVKCYSSSATMSHLVEQVRRTAELFFNRDSTYRKRMAKAGLAVPKTTPRHGEWTLCLVIMGRKPTQLPFFAQCGVARLVRDLERSQHAVAALGV